MDLAAIALNIREWHMIKHDAIRPISYREALEVNRYIDSRHTRIGDTHSGVESPAAVLEQ